MADLEWNGKVSSHTRFEIASMSKMFTGAAARILVDQGKLDLEAPVARYLAGIPSAWKRMKVRHLVDMTCGLGEDWGSDLIPYGADVTASFDDASMLKAFAGMKLLSPIGTRFHYSSPAYAMLGMIVAKLSGVPLATFVQQNVVAKAAMTESSYIDNWALVPQRARGYRRDGGVLRKGWYLGQYLHARLLLRLGDGRLARAPSPAARRPVPDRLSLDDRSLPR
jgi:CubicO group peptidase (beta-lactamase class C family)